MMKLFTQKRSIVDIRVGSKFASVVIGGIQTCFLPINIEEVEHLNYYKTLFLFWKYYFLLVVSEHAEVLTGLEFCQNESK